MILLDEKVYRETKQIALGKIEKSPLLRELSEWFMSQYSVCVLNIQFDQLPCSERYRLYVMLANTDDYQKMYESHFKPKKEYQEQIAAEFRKLVIKYKFTDESKLQNLFVIYNDFFREARTEANWAAADEVKKQINKRYPVVWRVEALFEELVVFYYSDADIAAHEGNGTSRAIADLYYSILKIYDELNYYTRENIILKYDSKENLDKNYEGNMFYYTR